MFGTLVSILTGAIALNDVSKKAEADYDQREQAKAKGSSHYISSSGWRATSTNEKVWINSRNDKANGHAAVVGFKSGKVYRDYSVEGCEATNRALARMGCPFKLKEVLTSNQIGEKTPFWVPYNHIKGEYYLTKINRRLSEGYGRYRYYSLGSQLKYGFKNNIPLEYTNLTKDQYLYYGGILTETALDSLTVARRTDSINSMLERQKLDLKGRI